MNFHIFFIPYVFEVEESIFSSFAKLQYSKDLENLGQLPVSQVHLVHSRVLSIGSYGFQ